jgi:sugar/nucleoside kinase (ribokinase family)
MLPTGCKDGLLSFLKEAPKRLDAVVMPDFFLDRLISLNYDASRFFSMVQDVADRKGGSIDGIAQTDIRGGNAVNTASALAALGVKVTPIVCTSRLGLQQINYCLEHYNVDTSHIKISAEASLTTALEFKTETGTANVMLRDLGSLSDFGPSNLEDEDYKLIEKADYVCLFNWVGTKKFGTELAQTVFSRAKAKGKGKTYYDTADPTPKRDKIPELMEKVLKTRQVDILSVNENEAITYAALLSDETSEQRGKLRFDEAAMESARILAKHLQARIDLHTTSFSATFTKKHETVVPAFKIKTLRATGAGDAWNAGNILGDGNALSDECRLALANAVAACYLADLEGRHPTRQKLFKFIENSAKTWQAPR